MDACVGALAAARPEPVHETPAERLEHMTAEQRMEWAAERLPAPFMLSKRRRLVVISSPFVAIEARKRLRELIEGAVVGVR